MLRRAAALAALIAAALPAVAEARCTTAPRSWVAGSVDLCRGTLVYSDYVHDDYGADTGAVQTTSRTASLAPTAGDQGYPQAGQDATADLVRLTLRVRRGRLRVRGLVNALFEPGQTVLALAIDTDADPATGGGAWDGLGVSSRGWDVLHRFTRGNPRTNTITGEVPLPPGRRWRVQAATAIAESGQVMNVAFRGTKERAAAQGVTSDPAAGSWFEDRQAAALRAGDISEFGARVRVRDLRRGRTRVAPLGTGLFERVYRSDHTVGPQHEGVSVEGVPGRGDGGGGASLGFEQAFQYLGRFQPYGIYVPERGGAPYGMQMLFHGSSSVFSGLVNQPGMQQRFGEDLDRILVVPEARGQNGFGSDISERDLLDVMADVERTYRIDPDRVFAGGYSQGGYITYRMASLYPHRFAGAVNWVGFTGDSANGTPGAPSYTAGAVGNVIELVANLRWVPTAMLYAAADELVQVQTGEAMRRAFAATDNVFEFFQHPTAEHLTFAFVDDWAKEAAYTRDLRRVRNPPRVTFRTADFLGNPGLGIRHDRAYWVSRIRGRGEPTDYQDVDLTTHACGGALPVIEDTSGAGGDPVPWASTGQRVAATAPVAPSPTLTGTLRNVGALRVDARRACLRGKTVEYDIDTDGPVTLTLSDGRIVALPGGRATGTIARR